MQGSQKYERAVNKTAELMFLRDPPSAHSASHKVSPPKSPPQSQTSQNTDLSDKKTSACYSTEAT